MRTIGLDLGSKTVGIAMSDLLNIIATGVETFTFQENSYKIALEYIANFCKKNNGSKIILGYPKNMDGSIGERGKISENFAEKLKELTKLPVILWDERLTTITANKMLVSADVSRKKRKKVVDKIAATLILQNFLDSQGIRND